jgi:hypothetical protein
MNNGRAIFNPKDELLADRVRRMESAKMQLAPAPINKARAPGNMNRRTFSPQTATAPHRDSVGKMSGAWDQVHVFPERARISLALEIVSIYL